MQTFHMTSKGSVVQHKRMEESVRDDNPAVPVLRSKMRGKEKIR